ncbi:MAG: hypothetical protein LBG65_02260 [Puniceicoccales bacterium]|jgi:hypothetical protein|nr:hypothetical protein [Puniceicoccales bacterium]
MSTRLYQLNAQDWSPETFRYEIWEGKPWHWRYGKKLAKALPETGDTIVLFYAPSGCDDPGFYGWAVLERCHAESQTLYFLPATPTNHLKMDPWWNEDAKRLVDAIRGKMTQATRRYKFHPPPPRRPSSLACRFIVMVISRSATQPCLTIPLLPSISCA